MKSLCVTLTFQMLKVCHFVLRNELLTEQSQYPQLWSAVSMRSKSQAWTWWCHKKLLLLSVLCRLTHDLTLHKPNILHVTSIHASLWIISEIITAAVLFFHYSLSVEPSSPDDIITTASRVGVAGWHQVLQFRRDHTHTHESHVNLHENTVSCIKMSDL